MKKLGKIFTLSNDVFQTDIVVCCGFPAERAVRLYEKTFGRKGPQEPVHDSAKAACIRTNGFKGSVLWFKDAKPGGGVVAHEVFHAVFAMLYYSGVGLDEASEETWAYCIDWMTKGIGRKLW